MTKAKDDGDCWSDLNEGLQKKEEDRRAEGEKNES